MNLLKETVEILTKNGKLAERDVRWVGTLGGGTPQLGTWEQFVVLANFDYYDGYGSNVVSTDLVIVGDDWWLERGEYDGSEWWEFKTLPMPPASGTVPLTELKRGNW